MASLYNPVLITALEKCFICFSLHLIFRSGSTYIQNGHLFILKAYILENKNIYESISFCKNYVLFINVLCPVH